MSGTAAVAGGRKGGIAMAEVINLMLLEPGIKVATTAGATVEVVDYPKDNNDSKI